ncbi:MAG: DUF1559 domain-containing protein [Pirellulaceae bacterium]
MKETFKFQLTMSTASLLLLGSFLLASPVEAAEPETVRELANGTTLCIIQVDTARLQLPQFESLQQFAPVIDELKQAVGGQSLFIAIDIPYRNSGSFVRLATKTAGVRPAALNELLEKYRRRTRLGEPRNSGDWTLVSIQGDSGESEDKTDISDQLLPLDIERWTAAGRQQGDFPIHVTVVPPSYVERAFRELEPELPDMLGGGSSLVLVDGIQWAHFACDPASMKTELRVQSANEAAATGLAKHVPKFLRSLIEAMGPQAETSRGMLLAMVGLVPPQVHGDQLVWAIEDGATSEQVLALAGLAFRAGAAPMEANQTMNNLKQIALGIHNYASANNCFPPNAQARGASGRSGLSWRVHLLPYLGEVELYEKFKLDEPWDSPHNIQLLPQMPRVYESVTLLGESRPAKPFHTTYVSPVGEKTIFGGKQPVTFSMITDGTSNTAMLVELAPEHAIAWTSPEEYPYDPQMPAAKLYDRDGKTMVALGDGSVRSLQIDNSSDVWNALFTMNGGETVNPE